MRGRLEVGRVAGVGDDLQTGARDPGGDRFGAGAAGRVEGAGDDEGRGRDAGEAVVERAPWRPGPAPRRLAARPAGALRRRSAWRRARRAGGHRGVAGEDRLALPFVHERLDAVALEAVGEGVVGGHGGRARSAGSAIPADGLSRMRRRTDAPGGRRPGAGRSVRPASTRRRGRGGPRSPRIAGEVVGGTLDAARPDRRGSPSGRGRAGRRRSWRNRGERRRMRAPARPAAGEAVEQQQRDPPEPRSAPPSGGRRRRCRSWPRQGRRRRRPRPRGAARRCGPGRSEAQDPDARPADRGRRALRARRPDRPRRYSPPSAVTIGPKSMPCGVPNSSS